MRAGRCCTCVQLKMVGTYAGRSQRDVKVEKSSKFAKIRPVQRAVKKGNLCSPELDIYSTYFTCT